MAISNPLPACNVRLTITGSLHMSTASCSRYLASRGPHKSAWWSSLHAIDLVIYAESSHVQLICSKQTRSLF